MKRNSILSNELFSINPNIGELSRMLKSETQKRGFDFLSKLIEDSIVQGVLKITLENLLSIESLKLPPDIACNASQKLANTLRTHSKLPIDFSSLENANSINQLYEHVNNIKSAYLEEFKITVKLIEEISSNWVIFKGLASAAFYQEAYQRDCWDIDIYFQNYEEAINSIQKIISEGGEFGDMKISSSENNKISWKMHVFSPNGILIEFHVGPIQGYADDIVKSEIFKNSVTSSVSGISFRAPKLNDLILLLVSHSYQEGIISQKDINDTENFIKSKLFDQTILIEKAKTSNLHPVLFQIIKEVSKRDSIKKYIDIEQFELSFWEVLVAKLFASGTKKLTGSFQIHAFFAQVLYILQNKKMRELNLVIISVYGRIRFGLERLFFPEKDARSHYVSKKVQRVKRFFFPEKDFATKVFQPKYFSLLHHSENESSIYWSGLYTSLKQKNQQGTIFAQKFYCWPNKNDPSYLIGHLGCFVPLNYYRVKGEKFFKDSPLTM